LRGKRKGSRFECPHCGHKDHADRNAAVNIRNRYTVLRSQGGESWSVDSEALEQSEGKPTTSVVGN
jgi:transposase